MGIVQRKRRIEEQPRQQDGRDAEQHMQGSRTTQLEYDSDQDGSRTKTPEYRPHIGSLVFYSGASLHVAQSGFGHHGPDADEEKQGAGIKAQDETCLERDLGDPKHIQKIA